MNLTTLVEFKEEKEERAYRFFVPANCPLGEAYDAAQGVSSQIFSIIKQQEDARREQADKIEASRKEKEIEEKTE